MTITNAAGTTTTLNLSDCASAYQVGSEITRVEGLITTAQAAAEAAQADVDALEKALGAGFSEASTVATQLAAVKATADAAAVKTSVDAALELKADKTQVATDIATAKSEAINEAAIDAATKADAALKAAKADTEDKNKAMDARVNALEAAVGANGSVSEMIDGKIESAFGELDFNGSNGSTVSVSLTQVDGKITTLTVDDSKAAKADDLTSEAQTARAAEQALGGRIDALDAAETGRVSVLEAQVAALNAATHFEGIVEFDPSAEGATTEGYESGDIVIYGNKEFIFDGNNEKWIELGDTTAESNRISALENKVGSTSVADQIDAKIAALSSDDKTSEDANLVSVTVSQANGVVTGISVNDTKLDTKFVEVNESIAGNAALIQGNTNSITTINDTTIPAINTRLNGIDGEIEGINKTLSTMATSETLIKLTARVAANEASITTINTKNGEQDTAIATADAKGAQGISDAANALAEAQAKVASVSAGNYISVGNDAKNPTIAVTVAGTVTEGNTGIVTGNTVYEALC